MLRLRWVSWDGPWLYPWHKGFLEPMLMDPSAVWCHLAFDPSLWQKDVVAGRTPSSTTQGLLQKPASCGQKNDPIFPTSSCI